MCVLAREFDGGRGSGRASGADTLSWKVSDAPRRTAPHTPCFVGGTEIATDKGPAPIEDLRVGDRVLTRDNGYRRIRWIGARHFDSLALREYPDLRPVTLERGSLGPGMPERDLTVSPQHRILLTGKMAIDLGGETEILAPAVDLHAVIGTRKNDSVEVTYYHILFDAHEIVWANGCWSESFLPEAAALDGLHEAQLQEILTIFPELASDAGLAEFSPARLCVATASQATAQAAA